MARAWPKFRDPEGSQCRIHTPHLGRRADALVIVCRRSTRTRNLRKVHHRIVPENLTQRGTRRHNVEVIGVPVFVGATLSSTISNRSLIEIRNHQTENSPINRAPLRIAAIRTQVRHHHSDALPRRPACSARATRTLPGARQLVARPAAGAAPRRPSAEERLRGSRRVDARGDARLPGKVARRGAAATGAFCTVVVTLYLPFVSVTMVSYETSLPTNFRTLVRERTVKKRKLITYSGGRLAAQGMGS